ncbi:MAG: ABC-type lipoprotein export system ATPase subunit [Oleispira sp.]|jgi:ABC-type lipoprotein export system ATPase subunit
MSNYFIEKIQVEGGFLDGLDLQLESGLNSIIGARGTGKSTLVELVRYCLGVKGHTLESDSRAQNHAKSVLKDGQITLSLTDGVTKTTISRSVDSPAEMLPSHIRAPLIFSQTEVETIGLLSSGRMKLLDGFLDNLSENDSRETSSIATIRSYSAEMHSINAELSEYEDKLLKLPGVEALLKELEPKEKEISGISDQAAEKTAVLQELTAKYTTNYNEQVYVDKFYASGKLLETSLSELVAQSALEVFPNVADGNDILLSVKEKRSSAIDLIVKALATMQEVDKESETILSSIKERQAVINIDGQKLRVEIEALKAGAGEIVRKGQNLRKEKAMYDSIKEIIIDLKAKLVTIRRARNEVLDSLEHLRSERTRLRVRVAEEMSARLAPQIRIIVEEASRLDEYTDVLMGALKGSGIQYKDLAPAIAEAMPPRELLNYIETSDVEGFITQVPISKDRASKVINSLRFSLDEIATVLLSDDVSFELLDGTDYKDFSELSTGQRCTVILPIILDHTDSILVIDQPEDHIDNAFIVDTLISAILRRSGDGQVIVTTHNANVPVLGDAKQVVYLGSDGSRGFILGSGPLNSPKIVQAISSVMEGGEAAFGRRAEFYADAL